MLYIYRLTIPANTAKASMERTDFRLPFGVLTKVEVAFPPGPQGLGHALIYHDEHQIFPSNLGEDYAWDNVTITWEGEYELPENWNGLSLRGWNLDDTYEHTITARFQVGGRTWGLADLLVSRAPLSVLEE